MEIKVRMSNAGPQYGDPFRYVSSFAEASWRMIRFCRGMAAPNGAGEIYVDGHFIGRVWEDGTIGNGPLEIIYESIVEQVLREIDSDGDPLSICYDDLNLYYDVKLEISYRYPDTHSYNSMPSYGPRLI